MIKIGGTEIVDIAIGSTPIEKAYIGSTLVWEKTPGPQPETYELYMWLDGTDALVSSKWVDKVSGFQWAVTGATHGTDYYEFANPTEGVADKYASIAEAGPIINLEKHWKIVADVEIASTTQNGYVMDLCAYGTTETGYNGLAVNFTPSVGPSMNAKIGVNTALQTTSADDAAISLPDTWNRMTLMWECVDIGNDMSRINAYMDGTLKRYSADFSTIRWNNFRTNASPFNTVYIGRGFLNSTNYKMPLRFRLHDLKIYRKLSTKIYDAQVEYLASSGTQYINTGIAYDSTVRVEMRVKMTDKVNSCLLGIYYNNGTARRWSLILGDGNGRIYCYNNTVTNKYRSYTVNTWYSYIYDYRYLITNGTSYDTGASTFSTDTYDVPIYVFGRHNFQPSVPFDNVDLKGSFSLQYMKIWKGGVVVRDYIPVRKDGVGYLYDMVSGTLFGNDGTGSFTYGDDVT